jgi:predicted signal transduction protein with EAL and GGDEF domain
VLSQLHALGVRISLDDFGTGYSSLSYLHNFPLQKVKIDRSFLEGIDSDRPLTLLRGVARLSADLGMSVVVEGIETNEQLELISADGTVTEAQGYLFSRPVPAVRVRQLLNASHGRRCRTSNWSRFLAIDRLRIILREFAHRKSARCGCGQNSLLRLTLTSRSLCIFR